VRKDQSCSWIFFRRIIVNLKRGARNGESGQESGPNS